MVHLLAPSVNKLLATALPAGPLHPSLRKEDAQQNIYRELFIE